MGQEHCLRKSLGYRCDRPFPTEVAHETLHLSFQIEPMPEHDVGLQSWRRYRCASADRRADSGAHECPDLDQAPPTRRAASPLGSMPVVATTLSTGDWALAGNDADPNEAAVENGDQGKKKSLPSHRFVNSGFQRLGIGALATTRNLSVHSGTGERRTADIPYCKSFAESQGSCE